MTTTIVVPCFNEADRLDVEAFAGFDAITADFLFVDDGSTDDTGAVLQRLVERDPGRFRVLRLDRNRGKAEAVRRGVRDAFASGADIVGFVDADLSAPLGEVPALIEKLEDRPGVVAVFGSRVRLLGRSIDRRWSRHYAGRVFATLVSMAVGLPVYDTQCGAKFFRAEAADAFEAPFLSRWIFDVEVLARLAAAAREAGRDPADLVVESPLGEWREIPGSKLRFRHGLRALIDLVRIRRRYR